MERVDFCSCMTVLRRFLQEDQMGNQLDLMYALFRSFLQSEEAASFDLDNGQVCRWLNGMAKVSPKITGFYLTGKEYLLAADIREEIFPYLSDPDMAIQEFCHLILQDPSVSERKKRALLEENGTDPVQQANFLADVLCFALGREFLKRDARTKTLRAAGNLSPSILDFIFSADPPRPCSYFCGRDVEMEQLHDLLSENGKVFVHGIPGIGKSELAKAYASRYQKEYTNLLYIAYSGNLVRDISEMDFAEDQPEENEQDRFRRHNRFLRSLQTDTLLIVDNFDTAPEEEAFLPVLLKYRCQILFTTRYRPRHYTALEITEIQDAAMLFQLAERFYPEAADHTEVLEQVFRTVHAHTLAVELAARLLGKGVLTPEELLEKLKAENVALQSEETIHTNKDNRPQKATYYQHIHLLFSLYKLSAPQQAVLRCMALVPPQGISVRRLVQWMQLSSSNTPEELVDAGFLHPQPGYCLVMHPLIREITLADEKPSVTNCRCLLQEIQKQCLLLGGSIDFAPLLFQTVDGILDHCIRDDPEYFLLWLEDVFGYADNYSDEPRLRRILEEIRNILERGKVGKARDHAILLDYTAALTGNYDHRYREAAELDRKALDILNQQDSLNSTERQLFCNISSNLSLWYTRLQQPQRAYEQMKLGLQLLSEGQVEVSRNTIPQILNFSIIAANLGRPEEGIPYLQMLRKLYQQQQMTEGSDYAEVTYRLGTLYLAAGQPKAAKDFLEEAWQIFKTVYADQPKLLEEKKAFYRTLLQMLGAQFLPDPQSLT